MNNFKLSEKSQKMLEGVHPRLVAVVNLAIGLTETDFTVTAGVRTQEEQAKYVVAGTSRTLHSKHLKQSDGYSHAVDLVPLVDGEITWKWGKPYDDVSSAMKKAASDLGVKIKWGGDWKTFRDGPHYELA